MSLTIPDVSAARAQLWDAGFRPVPVLTGDKKPLGNDWTTRARQDPPESVRMAPVAHALNTGILADGLVPIDIDIDDPAIARQARALVLDRLGEAPMRFRRNSPRCLILYRAAEGEPSKLTLTGGAHSDDNACKIEILGRGNQFVAYGSHPSGADLEWFPEPPGHEALSALTAVTVDHRRAAASSIRSPAAAAQAKPPCCSASIAR